MIQTLQLIKYLFPFITKATLGVEISDKKNKAIYDHFGFTEYIKSGIEFYPDCQGIAVEYYGKTL